MKVLFICKANVGRSQMAQAIFNKLSDKHVAKSAGLNPGMWEGKSIRENTQHVIVCLDEEKCDALGLFSKKITEELVNWADKIIVIGEKDNWPEYLKDADNVEYWDIEDPKDKDLEGHRETIQEIKKRVKKLIKEIE